MPQYNIKQVKGATQGSVLFLGPNGVVSENNSKLFWNITSSRLEIGGDLIVSGSFSVLGSASNIFTTNLVVSDPIILLAGSQSGAPALDSGFFINRGTGATQAFIWDESDGKFAVIQTNNSSTAIGNVTISSGAEMRSLRYNFFDTGAPSGAASSYINAPSGASIGLNAAGTIFFTTPQFSSSAQNSFWDIGANNFYFSGSGRLLKINAVDSGANIPTFEITSLSSGQSSLFRTGLSFSHTVGVAQNGVLERGYVIEVRDSGTFSGTAVGLVIDVTGVTNSNRAKRGLRIVDGSQANGYLLVSDTNGYATWTASTNIFNGPTGSGTTNYLARWISSSQLGTGSVYDDGTNVGIGTASPNAKLQIYNGYLSFNLGWGISHGGTVTFTTDSFNGNSLLIGMGATGTNQAGEAYIAMGLNSRSTEQGIAIGSSTIVGTATNDGIAIGRSAQVNASLIRGVAIGRNANARHNNAWAIGYNAITTQDNEFNFGVAGTLHKFTLNGNVGIGTVSNTVALHVFATQSGAFRLQDTTQGTGRILVSDANGVGTWTSSSSVFNGPTGSGTVNYLPRWSTSTQLSSTSSIYDTGDTVLISNSATSSFLGIGPNGTNAKVVVSYQASANSTTTLFVDGPSSNTVTGGGHAAYFRRNVDNAGATSSVVTIEHTNRSGGSPGASTLRIMSGYNGKLSQFQALSGGVFQIGNTYSDSVNRSLLTLNMDTNTLPDPTNNDRYSLRVIDNLPNLGSAATRYGVSVVMGASFSPQNPSVQKLYGIYSDVSGVGSTSSTASVYAGAFVGGNVAIAGVGGTAFAGALLHVSGANYNIPLIIASGSSSDDLVRITQVGTGNAFVVEDSSNPDSTGFVIDTNGNVGIGTASSASYKMNILGSSSFTGYTRKMQSGTYSFINLGANTALDAQYLTNSSANQAFNIGSVGLAAPQGLTTSSRAYFIGLAGVSYWNRDTNFGPTQPTGIGGNAATLIGTLGEVAIVAPTSGGTAFGGAGLASVLINQTAGTTVSNMFGVRVSWSGTNLGYTNNYYGFYMVDDFSNGNATNIGNRYGIYIDDVQAQNIFQGTVSIGNTTKTYKLNITGSASMDGFRLTTGAVNNYILTSDTNGVGTWTSPASIISSGGGVTGSGTTNYGAIWITSNQLGTGSIYDSGTAVGIATQSDGAYALNVYGDVNILGTLYATSKSFEIVHPLDPTKRLIYGSLEGPEYGVYYRGKLDNESIINLPDYWTALVDDTTISVNITPIGQYQRLFVDKIVDNKVYIGSDNSGSPNCYYVVYAERKDIPKIIVE